MFMENNLGNKKSPEEKNTFTVFFVDYQRLAMYLPPLYGGFLKWGSPCDSTFRNLLQRSVAVLLYVWSYIYIWESIWGYDWKICWKSDGMWIWWEYAANFVLFIMDIVGCHMIQLYNTEDLLNGMFYYCWMSTGWCPPVINWFISPLTSINYSYIYQP